MTSLPARTADRRAAPGREGEGGDVDIHERALVERLGRKDPTAFDDLVGLLYEPLCRLAYRILGTRDGAEDVVVDVFVAFWERPGQLERVTSLRSYFFRAVRNRSLNAIRQGRWARLVSLVDALDVPDTRARSSAGEAGDDIEGAVRRAVDGLPERCRTVYVLRREQGLTYVEIADVMGISVKTVETQMTRALARLRYTLEPYLG
jgi:RNA polymerase sigma-70 factor (ECF subfamily)